MALLRLACIVIFVTARLCLSLPVRELELTCFLNATLQLNITDGPPYYIDSEGYPNSLTDLDTLKALNETTDVKTTDVCKANIKVPNVDGQSKYLFIYIAHGVVDSQSYTTIDTNHIASAPKALTRPDLLLWNVSEVSLTFTLDLPINISRWSGFQLMAVLFDDITACPLPLFITFTAAHDYRIVYVPAFWNYNNWIATNTTCDWHFGAPIGYRLRYEVVVANSVVGEELRLISFGPSQNETRKHPLQKETFELGDNLEAIFIRRQGTTTLDFGVRVSLYKPSNSTDSAQPPSSRVSHVLLSVVAILLYMAR